MSTVAERNASGFARIPFAGFAVGIPSVVPLKVVTLYPMNSEILVISFVGFVVMMVFPLLFWWALSVAILKQSRASAVITVCVGLTGVILTVLAVWNTIERGYPG